jgi:membrane-bound ClpP family serine protease
MTYLVKTSRWIALFVGGAGFLFGQLFAGEFSIAGTLAGVGGVAAGMLTLRPWRNATRFAAFAACAMGLFGAGMHAWDYYSVPQLPGNYYAWFLTAPFAAALAFIAFDAARVKEG